MIKTKIFLLLLQLHLKWTVSIAQLSWNDPDII